MNNNCFLDSVNNELRNIEGKRQNLLSELSLNHKKIEDAKTELIRQEAELEKLKISVKQVICLLNNSKNQYNYNCIILGSSCRK